ncbi:MAG: hypothetical protein JXR76_23180 [Deltaproteobacteria bacterium]|nr:hypothetical protein [Deltaproteobacteria bacterium]
MGYTDYTYMRKAKQLWIMLIMALFATSCLTAEEEFINDRLLSMCDEAYYHCGLPTGCVLDSKHYVEGGFPGVRRVVVETEENNMDVQVRVFIAEAMGGGTEMLVQLYETDCTVNRDTGKKQLIDVDLIEEAGDDRVLIFNLHAMQEGEHVVEIYSDMTARFLLIAE